MNTTLRREILQHVVNNPEGMDTSEGIARFWVLRQRVEIQITEVENALDELVNEDLLRRRELRDSSGQTVERYYHLNPDRLSEIRTLLKSKQNT